jgi:hypothetical protein
MIGAAKDRGGRGYDDRRDRDYDRRDDRRGRDYDRRDDRRGREYDRRDGDRRYDDRRDSRRDRCNHSFSFQMMAEEKIEGIGDTMRGVADISKYKNIFNKNPKDFWPFNPWRRTPIQPIFPFF